jgi:hypothetical protein
LFDGQVGNEADEMDVSASRQVWSLDPFLRLKSRLDRDKDGGQISRQNWLIRPSFADGDGLNSRFLGGRKMSIGQVPTLRILTVCGEVAERLKAAVC